MRLDLVTGRWAWKLPPDLIADAIAEYSTARLDSRLGIREGLSRARGLPGSVGAGAVGSVACVLGSVTRPSGNPDCVTRNCDSTLHFSDAPPLHARHLIDREDRQEDAEEQACRNDRLVSEEHDRRDVRDSRLRAHFPEGQRPSVQPSID